MWWSIPRTTLLHLSRAGSVSSNYAFFGGTFDPVHRGHMAVARAALADPRFQLERIYLVPAAIPPHKQGQPITSYVDRLTMLELALKESGEQRLVASKLESADRETHTPNYSIDSVRRLKGTLRRQQKDANLYLMIGIDSFLQIASWREPAALLKECKFIIASRPGFSLADAADALPKSVTAALSKNQIGQRIFLLPTVAEDVSSTQIRAAVAKGHALESFVPESVANYIEEHRLYR